MRIFDYSFLKEEKLSANYARLLSEISLMQGKNALNKVTHKKLFDCLQQVAIIESVRSSNEIEGIATTRARFADIFNGVKLPRNHAEEEIIGYKDALSLIHTSFDKMQFCEKDILLLHRLLFSHTPDGGGAYKKQDNVISQFSGGRRIIRFKPLSAPETPEAMEQLVLAYDDAARDRQIPPLLLIPCVILDFLCIHPFDDGNGRMSRLLTLLLLYRSGFDAGRYVSFEGYVNKYRGEYYEALYSSSQGWYFNKNDYMPYIENFTLMLYMCYTDLHNRIDIAENAGGRKADRIIALLKNRESMSKAQIHEYFPDISVSTIESALAELIRIGEIEKIGTNKNAAYRAKR